ncbi:hypothetical protein N7494_000444 [Penicillium frequentans]|uniref:Uncharacterized protein n=1 Tax=Penicillium frequentans TaxID=3151616 RepID=A0AAD6D687_9EURO|nr:hypothetical protein N7494_000444 [Penicillium glabrum]
MSSTNFRVESFRPWNPSQAKSQSLRESPGTCRYPSPVSITAASPPLNPNKVGIRSIEIDTHKVERHPLPSRPPTEVCLEGQHSETQVTRSESVGVGQTPLAIHYPETANLDNTTQPQHTVDIDEVAFTSSPDNLPQEADLQSLNLGWHDSELVDFDRQEPHTVDSGCVNRQAEQGMNIEAIDPAVLSNCDPPATEQAQMTEGQSFTPPKQTTKSKEDDGNLVPVKNHKNLMCQEEAYERELRSVQQDFLCPSEQFFRKDLCSILRTPG